MLANAGFLRNIVEDLTPELKATLAARDIAPETTATYDIGSAALQWQEINAISPRFMRDGTSGATFTANLQTNSQIYGLTVEGAAGLITLTAASTNFVETSFASVAMSNDSIILNPAGAGASLSNCVATITFNSPANNASTTIVRPNANGSFSSALMDTRGPAAGSTNSHTITSAGLGAKSFISMTSLLASNDFVSQMTGISTFFQGYAIQFFADVTDIDVDGHGSMMRGAYISGKALIGSLAIGAFMSVYLDSNGQTAQITGKGGHLFGTIVGDNAGATVSGTGATGSGYVAGSTDLVASADGAWQHGPGTNAVAGSFQVGDGGPMLRPNGDVDITGDLNHDGSNIGFFATAPAAQTAAYTQTYATATRTHSNPTAAAVGDLVATNGGWGASTEANFDLVHSTIDQLVADMANIKQVVNQVIDDGQTYGLLQ